MAVCVLSLVLVTAQMGIEFTAENAEFAEILDDFSLRSQQPLR